MSRRLILRLALGAVALVLGLVALGLFLRDQSMGAASGGQSNSGPAMTVVDAGPVPTLTVAELQPVAINEQSVKDGMMIAVLSVVTQTRLGDFTPDTGNAFLVIDARIENQGRERGAYSFLFFGVTDAAGKIYRPPRASPNMAPGPALISGELDLKAVVRGNVVIEMPLSLASGVIKYTDERANSEYWYVHQFAWK